MTFPDASRVSIVICAVLSGGMAWHVMDRAGADAAAQIKPTAQDEFATDKLKYAIRERNPAEVTRLIQVGADVNTDSYRILDHALAESDVLFESCAPDRAAAPIRILTTLCTAGLRDVNGEVSDCDDAFLDEAHKRTLLTALGCVGCAGVLADVLKIPSCRARLEQQDKCGDTPLSVAVKHGHAATAALLRNAGATR